MPTLTDRERLLAALAQRAVHLGLRDGKHGAQKPMTIFRLVEVMGVHDLEYAQELRRIYGAAVRMQRKQGTGA